MSMPSRAVPEAAPRKKLRKGTPSDQGQNLRHRVAQLENLVESLLLEKKETVKITGDSEKGAAEVLSSLRALPPTPDSPESPLEHHENAPLLSLFNNAVLSHTPDQNLNGTLDDPPRPAILDKTKERTRTKQKEVREALLSLCPSKKDIETIMGSCGPWWLTWQRLLPEMFEMNDTDSPLPFVSWGIDQENPVIVALALLCLTMSLQQVRPSDIGDSLNLPLPLTDLVEHYLTYIDRIVISDNEYVCSFEGIELLMLRAKMYIALGQPRKAWLLFHRAISFAQLLSLHRKCLTSNSPWVSMTRRQTIWWSLFELDRYLSLLLGLPYAVSENQHDHLPEGQTEIHPSPTAVYRRKLAIIAGQVVDRNQKSGSPSFPRTLEIEQALHDLNSTLPDGWCNILPLRATGAISRRECFERILVQFWHHQIKSFLHLPFMLQSGGNPRYEYSRIACLEATRDLVRLYHVMKVDVGDFFFLCRILDFQGFTASVLLLLGLLGYGQQSSSRDAEQEAEDWRLVDRTVEILRETVADQVGDSCRVARQAIQVLETLGAASHGNQTRTNAASWNGKVVVPYVGTISVSPGVLYSAPEALNSEVRTGSDSSVNPEESISPILEGEFGLPQIDVDWRGMVNADMDLDLELDQNWNWYLDGGEMPTF
ncbi:MAG: hypothetical protein M1824_005102 [Vezdaea acicularis]|nr:MAG: hypothetical protein M1824_005102 [Vezdaea acicularis]